MSYLFAINLCVNEPAISSAEFILAILSYNHPEITRRCVQSALDNLPAQQITLMHNGSRLENKESLKKLFPEINHLELTENRGYSGGANEIFRQLKGKAHWILFLTNDCVLPLQKFSPPQKNGLYSVKIWSRKKGAKVDSIMGAVNLINGNLRHLKCEQDLLNLNPFERIYVPGSAFWVDFNSWQKLSGFDESLGTYWEDVDLSLKAPPIGIPVAPAFEPEIIHSIGKTCHKNSYYTNYLFQRNRRIVSLRHSPRGMKWRLNLNLTWRSSKDCLRLILKKDWVRWKEYRKALRDGAEISKQDR